MIFAPKTPFARLVLAVSLGLLPALAGAVNGQNADSESFRVMAWNIWHGGREDGEEVGPQRVVDVIKSSGADIVAMQETYGSGEKISEALGFHFHPRGTNLSIHSRFPVVEDISVFAAFKCVGGLIQLPDKSHVAFYSIWLPYQDDIWIRGSRDTLTDSELAGKCNASRNDLTKIRDEIHARLSDRKYKDVPIIIAGDFNSMSHLDYTEVNRDQFVHVADWPTSRVLIEAGYRDSYRETNPAVSRVVDSTWSPKFVEQEQDRIDYVYYKSKRWRANESKVVKAHADWFPSDHAAVVTQFSRRSDSANQSRLRVATYNIRRGFGTDNKQFLMRSARAIKRMDADVVGLQEIDNRCKRSGFVNQAAELGRRLTMHSAFGIFMPYDGGKYGLATLSGYPIVHRQVVKLPDGREPRVALATTILLPDDQRVLVVNIHLDWIDNDKARFEQAKVVGQLLEQQELPWILLGDFNDTPDSRTLDLFRKAGSEVKKDQAQPFTISSDDPKVEIDYLFVGPEQRWEFKSSQVVNEKLTSDHLPVVAELILVNESANR